MITTLTYQTARPTRAAAEALRLRYDRLSAYPEVFRSLTGLTPGEFDALVAEVRPRFAAAQRARLSRPGRRRAIGAGHPFGLESRDQILLTVIWQRQHPTHEALGHLFGVSEWTAMRAVGRVRPLLEAAGFGDPPAPCPRRGRRRRLDALLRDTPQLALSPGPSPRPAPARGSGRGSFEPSLQKS
jgi:hypothetical protein